MRKSIFTLINEYRLEIMGVAALWVFAFHEWTDLIGNTGIVSDLAHFVSGAGFGGVDIFLFLSGMGLTHAIEKYPVKVFYKRRFARVLPPYVLTVVLAALFRQWEVGYFLKTIIGYHFWTQNIYIVQWFGYMIIILYLVFPLYYYAFQKARSPYVFTVAALVVWYVAIAAFGGTIREDLRGFTDRIPIFLVGILCGWTARKREIVFSNATWLFALLILAVGFGSFYLGRYRGMQLPLKSEGFPTMFLIAISGVCLLAQAFHLLAEYGGRLGCGIRKIAVFYGKMSFEFYCIQDLLGEKLQWRLLHIGHFALGVILLVVMTAMAYGLYWLCKKISAFMVK